MLVRRPFHERKRIHVATSDYILRQVIFRILWIKHSPIACFCLFLLFLSIF